MVSLRGQTFAEYFRTEYPRIVAELDFILGDVHLARDVAQDAFIRQHVSWSRLAHYDNPGAWVRRVALRLAFRVKTRRSRESAIDADIVHVVDEAASDRRLDVRNAISQLPNQQRAAVVLHYYRDLPMKEVAAALGVRESTAKAHLFKARARLAELLVSYKID